jgi:hypothetical protein
VFVFISSQPYGSSIGLFWQTLADLIITTSVRQLASQADRADNPECPCKEPVVPIEDDGQLPACEMFPCEMSSEPS